MKSTFDENTHTGQIASIRGNVIDACFTPASLPAMHNELRCGEQGQTIVEVESLLDAQTVRGIVLTPARDLARGDIIHDLGRPIEVPVGESLRGRMVNVFGEPIDHGTPLRDVRRRSIHASPSSAHGSPESPRGLSHRH